MTALVLLGLFVFCGAVGFLDDFLKVRKRNSGGLSAQGQAARPDPGRRRSSASPRCYVPEHQRPDGGQRAHLASSGTSAAWTSARSARCSIFVFVIMAMSNGVNLTDGLDGLATGASILVLGAYALIGFWQYRHWCADPAYAQRERLLLPGAGPAGDRADRRRPRPGRCVGFLWWNTSPARIFMGDTGALGLGGLIGGLAMATRTIAAARSSSAGCSSSSRCRW